MSDAAFSQTKQRPLILVPTAAELAEVPQESLRQWREGGAAVELCGLGPVAAAAKASQLIARLAPALVVLIGIAGAYDAEAGDGPEADGLENGSGLHLVIGRAYEFGSVACHGLGVGEGPRHRSGADLGWDERFQLPEARGVIRLALPEVGQEPREEATARLLLSVFAASADRREAAARRHRYPEALAEDMEAYAVAVACRMARVPLRVIRGISNAAGDRDHRHWRVAPAVAAAARLVDQILAA